MHDYAIFGHDRTTIGRFLGIGSILLASGISQILEKAYELTKWEPFTAAVITAGIIYFALHWLFNEMAWKVNFFKIPDLNGTWEVTGKTLDENGETKYGWEAEIDIEQTWKDISISLRTENSQSSSYTATLLKRPGKDKGWILSYSYKNDPNLEQSHELNSHKGFCEIEFDHELKTAKATYFNSNGRRSYGIMSLIKG